MNVTSRTRQSTCKTRHRIFPQIGTAESQQGSAQPDRVTPPQAAGFSLVMLATTPEGDAYTFDEYAAMLAEAGFQKPTAHSLPASVNQAVISLKK